jgi:hypothetical protein
MGAGLISTVEEILLPARVFVWLRPGRYLNCAGPRHSCRGDHSVALCTTTRSEIAEKDNGLTEDCDNQRHDRG